MKNTITNNTTSIAEINLISKDNANNNESKISRSVAMTSRKQNRSPYGISPEAFAALLKNKN